MVWEVKFTHQIANRKAHEKSSRFCVMQRQMIKVNHGTRKEFMPLDSASVGAFLRSILHEFVSDRFVSY